MRAAECSGRRILWGAATVVIAAASVACGPRTERVPSPLENAQQVAFADVDGDGRQDLIVATSDRARWMRNEGEGTWGAAAELFAAQGADELVTADIDADGDVDVVSGSGAVFLNDGSGRLAESWSGSQRSAAVADFDGDGRLDVVTGSESGASLSVQRAGGTFEFIASASREDIVNVQAGDFDLDGDTDALLVSFYYGFFSESTAAALWRNDGNGELTLIPLEGRGGAEDLSPLIAFDADGDGVDDIAYGSGSSVVVRSGPVFAEEVARLETSSGVTAIVVERGRDGAAHLVTADRQANELQLHVNDGAGKFSRDVQVELECAPTGAAVGDVDGEGEPDWATFDECTNELVVVLR